MRVNGLGWMGAKAFLLMVTLAAGCTADSRAPATMSAEEPATTLRRLAQGGAFHEPLDVVATADGSRIFFSAFDSSGEARIFTIAAAGGPLTTLDASGFVYPASLAISPDDLTAG